MKRALVALAAGTVPLVAAPPAGAIECARVVVVALPAVTWHDISPNVTPALPALVRDRAAGSVSVRTISARTSYASGFATLGAASRLDAERFTAALDAASPVVSPRPPREALVEARVRSVDHLAESAREGGYGARPGALGDALRDAGVTVAAVGSSDLGIDPPAPVGYGRWAALAAMDGGGRLDASALGGGASGGGVLTEDDGAPFGVRSHPEGISEAVAAALETDCAVTFVDPGDLARADEYELATGRPAEAAFDDALGAADDVVAGIAAELDFERDLMIAVSPTSPWSDDEVHLGIALARGPGFEGGDTLESASTRRSGVVTLPDVAPTVLAHLDIGRPPAMIGRSWFAVPLDAASARDAGVELDRESIFVESLKTPVTVAFVVAQVLVYAITYVMIRRRARPLRGLRGSWVQVAALFIVAFPISTFVAGALDQHTLGAFGAIALFLAIDVALVTLVCVVTPDALHRLLGIAGATVTILFVDLLTGATLQLNTVLGYSPVVAGRFAGLGNIGFALLGVASLLTGVLLAHRYQGSRRALLAAACVLALAIVFDGAPQLGSDVGGVISLVPALGITLLLLTGRRVTVRSLTLGVLAGAVAVALFLAVDLSRPSDEQTHLARLYEDVAERGPGVFVSTVERKLAANIRLFRSTFWTYFVPPAVVMIALLLRRPRGRWQRLAAEFPRVRDGLVGGLLLGVIGFATNDSGIVIPAVVLTFLVPMAVIVHLRLDSEAAPA